MKLNRMSTFKKTYIIVVAIMLLVTLVASVLLWAILDSYEKTRPKHAAEKVFKDYFISMQPGELYEKYLPEALTFDNKENINRSFKSAVTTDSLDFFSVSVDEKDGHKYAVVSDKTRVAYFTLKESNKKAAFGFKYYELSDAEFFLSSFGDAVINVTKGNTLKVNGVTVDKKYITEADQNSAESDYMPDGMEGSKYDVYTVKGLLFEPEITIVSADGKAIEVELDEQENRYVEKVVYSEALEKEHSKYVIGAIEQYTKFLSNDGSFGAVSGYLDRNYPIYNRVRTIEVNWVRDHSGYAISEQKASEFVELAEGVFSCRVTMKETLMRPGYTDHKEFIDVTIYLHKVDNKYLIYNMVSN